MGTRTQHAVDFIAWLKGGVVAAHHTGDAPILDATKTAVSFTFAIVCTLELTVFRDRKGAQNGVF